MTWPSSRLIAATAIFIAVAGPTRAQDAGTLRGGFHYGDGGAAPADNDSLYQALGGRETIAAFTKDFVEMVSTDPKLVKFFDGVDLDKLSMELTNQFIDLSGGPVHYSGRDMKKAHTGLHITNAAFNRLAEDLRLAMDKHGVSFATQNRLLALLAPMQRTIVTQ